MFFSRMLAIADGAFDALGQPTLLDLSNNRLKTVNHNMFKHLSRLETIDLIKNHLEMIPGDTFDITQQRNLCLADNNLKTVSHTMFSHLSRLKFLCLENNKLETIPEDAFLGIGRLFSLRLDNYRLSTLSATLLGSLSHIRHLFLNRNPLVCD